MNKSGAAHESLKDRLARAMQELDIAPIQKLSYNQRRSIERFNQKYSKTIERLHEIAAALREQPLYEIESANPHNLETKFEAARDAAESFFFETPELVADLIPLRFIRAKGRLFIKASTEPAPAPAPEATPPAPALMPAEVSIAPGGPLFGPPK